MFKIPNDLLMMPTQHQSVTLSGVKIIESCHHETLVTGSFYINERVLICILSGGIEIDIDGKTFIIGEGQIGLISKNVYASYRKIGADEKGYRSVLFFLNDSYVDNFIQNEAFRNMGEVAMRSAVVSDVSLEFIPFIHSVFSLFQSELKYNEALLQLKVKELLIYITSLCPEAIHCLWNSKHHYKKDIVQLMEKHYLKYASLEEFAAMSGRSLSTFKRDFKLVFGTTPAKWLKNKRMEHAKYLLKHSGKSVTEVYKEVGYLNYTHFSRAFKKHFGFSPSQLK